MIGQIIFRLIIWFLLTANFTVPNIILGVAIALLLPRGVTSMGRLKDVLRALWQIVLAIPQAYAESIELMLRPHTREEVVMEPAHLGRTPGLIFLEIFLITFTPKTIVLKYHQDGQYEIHRVRRRRG